MVLLVITAVAAFAVALAVLRDPDGDSQAPQPTFGGLGPDSVEPLDGGRPQIGRAELAVPIKTQDGVIGVLHIESDPSDALVKVAFYRIVREALNNIQKHARATEVVVEYHREGESVGLVVRDDGVGFDPSAVTGEHMGVRIISERALAVGGEAEVRSHVGEGTVVGVGWQAGG